MHKCYWWLVLAACQLAARTLGSLLGHARCCGVAMERDSVTRNKYGIGQEMRRQRQDTCTQHTIAVCCTHTHTRTLNCGARASSLQLHAVHTVPDVVCRPSRLEHGVDALSCDALAQLLDGLQPFLTLLRHTVQRERLEPTSEHGQEGSDDRTLPIVRQPLVRCIGLVHATSPPSP